MGRERIDAHAVEDLHRRQPSDQRTEASRR